jgi:hypothetical protein
VAFPQFPISNSSRCLQVIDLLLMHEDNGLLIDDLKRFLGELHPPAWHAVGQANPELDA